MRKIIMLSLLLAAMMAPVTACTNLIVGKKASTDGSVMCTYNCDGFGFSGYLFYLPSGKHSPDEKIAVHGWGPTHEGQYVRQVDYTYNVVGLMNERQVTIVETTFDGRLELVNNDGLLDYFTLMRLALQRTATAREAIRCMVELVEELVSNILVLSKSDLHVEEEYPEENAVTPEPAPEVNKPQAPAAPTKPAAPANGDYHIVKQGDTLYRIALNNHTTVEKICRLNNIDENATLQLGQKIRVR